MTGLTQGYDPRTGAAVGEPVADSDPATIEAALAAAHDARRALAATTAGQRAGWLAAVADALAAAAEDLVDVADAETGLGRARLDRRGGPHPRQLDCSPRCWPTGRIRRRDRRPDVAAVRWARRGPALDGASVGPVAVFAASNFPFAFGVAGGDTASALAAGCPVVVKAHPGHPGHSGGTGRVVAGALRDAGRARRDASRVVHGSDAGDGPCRDPAVRAAGFTGSVAGGRALLTVASARPDPIPFYGELGSLNPVVVTPGRRSASADADRGRVRRVLHAGRRPVLHQARPAAHARAGTVW